MRIEHVEMLNDLACRMLADPPLANLVNDEAGDFIDIGGVSIHHAIYTQSGPGGPVKYPGYEVDVATFDRGISDYYVAGVFPVFDQAATKAIITLIELRLQNLNKWLVINDSFWQVDDACRSAWFAGYQGYKTGTREHDNPYSSGIDLHLLWIDGYEEARSEGPQGT